MEQYMYQTETLLKLTVFNTKMKSLRECLKEVFKSYDKCRKKILQVLSLLLKLVSATFSVPEKSDLSSW